MLFMSNKYSFAWAFCCLQFATTLQFSRRCYTIFLQEHEDCKKLETWGASLARAVQEFLFRGKITRQSIVFGFMRYQIFKDKVIRSHSHFEHESG